MPKSRESNRVHLCSFCGQHKDDVPLVVVSNQTKACICAVCALAVVEQTFGLMMKQDKLIREAVSGPQLKVVENRLKKIETDTDKVGVAIDKAIHGQD